jgi:ankyrin repeat protein
LLQEWVAKNAGRFRLSEHHDALSWAAKRNHIDVVQMLLGAEADALLNSFEN